MIYALVDANEVVVNMIEYDGISGFAVPDGLQLKQAMEWTYLGGVYSTEKPADWIDEKSVM